MTRKLNGNERASIICASILILMMLFASSRLPLVYTSSDSTPFFAAARAYSMMEALGRNTSLADFSGKISPDTISPQTTKDSNASSGGCKYCSGYEIPSQGFNHTISITDGGLRAEKVYGGIEYGTSMAFLGPDDMLVLEKDSGTVKRILNGIILLEPVLDVAVANVGERGILGIAVSAENDTTTYVFLYYTESGGGVDGDDKQGIEPAGNRLYRYELQDGKLVNPKLLLDLPAGPAARHNGGKVIVGPDHDVYLVVGDKDERSKSHNNKTGSEPNGTSAILRVNWDGQTAGRGILGEGHPLDKYYAYGIRNSFGIAFDPVTGKLWDTENGPEFGDEINLVEPGFNSGWAEVMGFASKEGYSKNLETFNGSGYYSDPEFVWTNPVGVTDLAFLNSSTLGADYENDLFVSDIKNGNMYHFELDPSRSSLTMPTRYLADRISNTTLENAPVVFASGFDPITDLEVGPDGYLYVLTFADSGQIYRIVRSAGE